MRFISADEIQAMLSFPKCIDLMRSAGEMVALGNSAMPLRQVMSLPDSNNKMGIMPGYLGGDTQFSGVKLLSLYPGNADEGFPSHMGLYILFDAEFGQPIALMDANALTAIRTASATAAATDVLSRKNARIMLVVGTGEQAESHIHALYAIREFDEIRIWGRDYDKAQVLAERIQSIVSTKMTAVEILEMAVIGADIVTTVTASPIPILYSSHIEPGMHINTVGASHRGVMEIAPDALANARLVVDHLTSALDQAGEMITALKQGHISNVEEVYEIGDIFLERKAGRTSAEDITIYKSLGIAAQDIVAAQFIANEAKRLGLGQELSM
ncbi:MAG: ornithine cyclodeaminase family protein [Parasphingorhabdus sp.]